MTESLVHFCWHCYGRNSRRAGCCAHCGRPIEAPPDTSYVDRLLWALDHPITERRMTAIRILGERGERRATGRLHALATKSRDPYQAVAALESLIAVEGVDTLRELLEDLIESGPVQVQQAARRALGTRRS